ncbi:MAG TPA: protein kinase [Polyangiaceae bacterium]|nr:protein kinase [Polyangiaceae bacterium]
MQCEACGHSNSEGARFCANCGALLPPEQKGTDPLIGQLVGGRFRVTGVLGEGGMGVVYVGEQQMGSTVRKVAIKTLHQHLSKDPSVRARFHRECGTVAQLEHPNTIKFYDFGETSDGTLYIAMEFVAGRSLADVLQREGPLDPERVVRIMRQVCGALDEAHGQGIIHRDLKPENVILTNRAGETDVVKVLDFGIAARSESADAQREQKLTQQGMVLGTPPYMSPEQFTGKALDPRSDVYSLGVMAYELLTGRLPFDADTPWQWATQHMTAPPIAFEVAAPTKNIAPPMRQAIMKALSKDRDQRQGSAREFFTEFSDGGRVTVDAPAPVAGHQSTGTAAMDVMPPAFNPPVPQVHAPAGPMGTPPGVAAVPPAPTRPGRSGGGKGLVIGLGAVGAVLLIAIAVVAARTIKPEDDKLPPPADNTAPSSAAPPANTGATTIAPLETAPPAPSVTAPPDSPTTPASPTHSTSPNTPATPKTNTGSTTTTPKPPTGGNCDACASLASSENIGGAVAAMNSCTDAAKKASCGSAIRRAAPSAVKHAALNGNCSQAKGIIAAAQAAGVPAAALNGALAGTSCK